MRLCVVGMGYVGLTAAVAVANMGHAVLGVENDPLRLAALRGGRVPFYEAGLDTLPVKGLAAGRLHLSGGLAAAAEDAAEAADLIMVTGRSRRPTGGTISGLDG